MRISKVLAGAAASMLLTGGALVLVPATAGAAQLGPVDPAIADGDPGSLRDVVENQATDPAGDTVLLVGGATYTLTCAAGGQLFHDLTPLTLATPGDQPPATIAMEAGCAERILDKEDADLTVRNIVFTGGRSPNDGGAIFSEDGAVTVETSTFIDNAGNDGGAIATQAGLLTVIRSTIANNCAEDDGGAVQASVGALFVNSTVTNNRQEEDGAIDLQADEPLTLVYSDVVENTFAATELDCGLPDDRAVADEDDVEPTAPADEPSNINVGEGSLISFGSVVALPRAEGIPAGDTPINCDGIEDTNPTQSSGYNYSDDATCGFTDPTDQQTAPNPLLGALADNGGPTPTRLPEGGSRLINAIPIASCSGGDGIAGFAVTIDQRGVGRPQETGCEIGSVEIVAPIVLEPTFTG